MAYPQKSVSLDVLRRQVESSKRQIWKLEHDSTYIVEFDMEQESKTSDVVREHFNNIRSEPCFPGNYCDAMKQLNDFIDPRFDALKEEYENDMAQGNMPGTSQVVVNELEKSGALPLRPAPIETPVQPAPIETPHQNEMDDETWRLMQQQIEHNNELLRLLHEDNVLKDQILDMVTKRISERLKKKAKLSQKRRLRKTNK